MLFFFFKLSLVLPIHFFPPDEDELYKGIFFYKTDKYLTDRSVDLSLLCHLPNLTSVMKSNVPRPTVFQIREYVYL